MLHAFEGTPQEMDMRSTLDKIAASLEGTFAVSLDALTEHMSVQAEDRVVIDPAIWEAVARAIERRDILRADYRRFDGKSGPYEIEPLHLLAYHLLTWIRETLRERGELRDWKRLRRLLSTHSLVTTVLPLADGRVLRIRKPSRPDPEQALLYQKLRIDWKAAFPPLKSFAKP